MPIARFQMPDGRIARFEVPEGTTPEEAQALMEEAVAGGAAVAPKPARRPGIGAEFSRGLESLLGSSGTGIAAFGGQESANRAAEEGLKRSQGIAEKYGASPWERVKQKYNDPKGGFASAAGEFVANMPAALASQAPQLAASLGAAKLGAMAGAPLGPVGSIVGGAGAAVASMYPQFLGSGLETQAAEAVKAGRPVNVDLPAAHLAAAGSSALEVGGGALALGRGIVSKVLGIPAKTIAEQSAKAGAKLAVEAQRTLAGTVARGVGRGLAVEMPVEMAQAVMNRAQAGMSLTDDEAMAEYGDTLGATAMVAPALGAAGRVQARSQAQRDVAQIEEQKQIKAEQDAAALAQQQEEQKAAQRQDPAYAQQINDKYNQLYAQHQAMLPGKLGAAATGADKLEREAQQAAADQFYEDNLKELEVEAAAVRPTLKAMQEQAFQAAQEKAQATAVSDSGESYDAGPGAVQQMTAERDVLYQQQAAAVKQALEAAKKGDMATAKAAQEQAAQLLQRAKALEKQLAGRQVPSNTTQAPPDNQQQIDRLTKQYGVAVQSGKMGQAEALRVELEKLHAAQKKREAYNAEQLAQQQRGELNQRQALARTQPSAQLAQVESEEQPLQDGIAPASPAATPGWRPRETPALDQKINARQAYLPKDPVLPPSQRQGVQKDTGTLEERRAAALQRRPPCSKGSRRTCLAGLRRRRIPVRKHCARRLRN
jgi:hypothetical protein